MEEFDKWKSQQYAVDIKSKVIFKIDDVEQFEEDVIVYGGSHTNTSKKLMTVNEAHYFEKIKESYQNTFF